MSSIAEVSQPTKVIVVTGATRAGKSTLAKLFETFAAANEKVSVVHQDRFFRDPKEMPKVSLQGAPYVKISYWDDDSCVDWAELMLTVNAAINNESPPTYLVVEGNMLISCRPLMALATTVIVISVDKWVCFDRRVESEDSRQHYLPYMIRMWQSHQKRFENVQQNNNTIFLRQTTLLALQHHKFSCVSELIIAMQLRSASREEFLYVLHREDQYSPEHKAIDVGDNSSVYGVELAAKLIVDSVAANDIDKIHGMLLGVALGDAGGAWCEFHRGKPVVWSGGKLDIPLVMSGRAGIRAAPPGAVTDDFQMTFLVVKHLIKNRFKFVPKEQAAAYIDWASKCPGGIGINTRDLFQHPRIKDTNKTYQKYLTAHKFKHQDPNSLSMSNGTLMRASAFAVCPERDDAILNSVADARLSNDNLVNISANAIYVRFVYDLVRNLVTNDVKKYVDPAFMHAVERVLHDAKVVSQYNDPSFIKVKQVVYHAINSAFYDTSVGGGDMSSLVNSADKKGFVLVALWVAFRYYAQWSLLRGSERIPIRETIRRVVILGGDTDTNAAITGALLGAAVGAGYLRLSEEFNVKTVLNVEYRYSTIKNIDNLTPAALPPYLEKLFDLYKNKTPVCSTSDDDDDGNEVDYNVVNNEVENVLKRKAREIDEEEITQPQKLAKSSE